MALDKKGKQPVVPAANAPVVQTASPVIETPKQVNCLVVFSGAKAFPLITELDADQFMTELFKSKYIVIQRKTEGSIKPVRLVSASVISMDESDVPDKGTLGTQKNVYNILRFV